MTNELFSIWNMFVVGYDDSFQKKKFGLRQIMDMMLEEIVETVALESCIYYVS